MFYFNFRKPKSFFSFQNTFLGVSTFIPGKLGKETQICKLSLNPLHQNADIAEGMAVETI